MQNKKISSQDWQSVILPNSGTNYSTVSPLQAIKGPFFAYMWAGVPSCVSEPSIPVGTVYASKNGIYGHQRIKTYEWLVFSKDDEFLVQDVIEKNKIPDHHTEGTPVMFHNAPEQIRNLFKK